MSDELAPLQKLKRLWDEGVEALGFKPEAFMLSPEETPEVHVIVELPEDAFTDDEQRETDATLAEIERQMERDEIEDKRADQVVEGVQELDELRKRLSDPDEGLLGGD